jgi:putative component of toxin-antitoxin plasmid stabilization module
MDQIIAGTNTSWFRDLPKSLTRRAAMYRRWAEMFADQRPRRDFLSRVNRLTLSVYVKLATNPRGSEKPEARRHLVVRLLKCVGNSVDRSQIKRELELFESMHFQAHSALKDKLRRMHDSANC